MSGKKSNIGLIGAIVIVIAVAGGAIAFMSKDKGGEAPVEQAQAGTQEQAPANLETAAGDAQNQTQPPVDLGGGITVEPGNPVVARVDGKNIMREDVYRFIQTMSPALQREPASVIYPMAVDRVIDTQIVQDRTDEANVTESDQYKREIKMLSQQIARAIYLQQQASSKVNEKMLKNAYDEYIKKVPDVEERRARHILVETEDKAKAVIEKLQKGNEKFEDLAKSLSIGPTAPRGGDLGYFTQKEMVPEFANAAFSMEKEAVSETPVKTQFGWHVIQVVDIRQRPKPTIEQMTPVLDAELRRNALDDLLKGWRKKAKIERFDINGKPLKEGANALGVVPPSVKEQPAEAKQDG